MNIVNHGQYHCLLYLSVKVKYFPEIMSSLIWCKLVTKDSFLYLFTFLCTKNFVTFCNIFLLNAVRTISFQQSKTQLITSTDKYFNPLTMASVSHTDNLACRMQSTSIRDTNLCNVSINLFLLTYHSLTQNVICSFIDKALLLHLMY